jgi:murein DD-endopeptidase MepM/ murein hydrolase activator NlpD
VRRRPPNACRVIVAAVLAAALPGVSAAQSAYKYRDTNGQWVFTDGAASAAAPAGDAISVAHEHDPLHVSVDRTDSEASTQLIGVNDCLCVVTVRVRIEQSDFAEISRGHTYQVTLDPGARQPVVTAPHMTAPHVNGEGKLRYSWTYALGSPKAAHTPTRPYRVPFAVGESFTVTQAYPTRITHVTPDSAYAVDFALPDGTPVYAAREGTVINVRHDSFRGAPLPAMLDQANLIEILHDDGTIGVYGHLHWDSIRVHIGQHVARGEYIADSGNTGFTTGPHLHFAVWRNAGGVDVSIPVQFAGSGGVAVTPQTSALLTAY